MNLFVSPTCVHPTTGEMYVLMLAGIQATVSGLTQFSCYFRYFPVRAKGENCSTSVLCRNLSGQEFTLKVQEMGQAVEALNEVVILDKVQSRQLWLLLQNLNFTFFLIQVQNSRIPESNRLVWMYDSFFTKEKIFTVMEPMGNSLLVSLLSRLKCQLSC